MIPILCLAAVFIIEYRGFQRRNREYRELEQFAEFLSDLKDYFYLCKNVTESIFRAAERVPGSLRKRLEEICFLLENDEMSNAMSGERFPVHLKYLRLFLIQCQSTLRYGSGKSSTESVFIKNMTELRRDVQNECNLRKQSIYLFAGVGIVAAVPIVFLPAVEGFGSATMEELKLFYESRWGDTVKTVFYGLWLWCYALLFLFRQEERKNPQLPVFGREGKKRFLDLAAGMIGGCGAMYLFRYFPLWQRFFALGCGALLGIGAVRGFFAYLQYLRKLGTEREVLSLQSMVLLLQDVPNMTILEILDVLGECAGVFRTGLRHCADEYVSEDTEALVRLQEKESNASFRRLLGRILVSERIGIKEAFSELASDRQFFREQLRIDAEQELKKKAANAQVIAFLPMLFLLFAYLIVPFLAVSLRQMGDIFREMEQIRFF